MFKVGEPEDWRETETIDIVKEISSQSNLKIKYLGKSVKGLIKEVAKKGMFDIPENNKIKLIIGCRVITLNVKHFDIESPKPSKEEMLLKSMEVFE